MKTKLSFMMPVFLCIILVAAFKAEDVKAHAAELLFFNASFTKTVYVHVYPISMVFNGYSEYDLHSRYVTQFYHYNTGGSTYMIPPNSQLNTINHDMSGATGGNTASVGFGKYKIVMNWGSGQDTCSVEYDYGYSLNFPNFAADLTLFFRDDNNNPRVNFKWSGSSFEYPIASVNREIVAWNQQDYEGSKRRREKIYGNFMYDNYFGNTYDVFPQDSRRDCGNENQSFEENRSGVLTLNLTIDKNVFTPSFNQLFDFPTNVIINPAVSLKINPSRILDFTEVIPYYPDSEFRMTVKSQAALTLYDNAKIIIRNHNKLTLDYGSYLTLNSGSEIRIKPGGIFCNEGAIISGSGSIIYEGGIHTIQCRGTGGDITISGGTDVCLESDAILEIPDNTSLYFTDIKSSLRMSDKSRILLGKNSKIKFENGASLISNNEESLFQSPEVYLNENKSISLNYKTLSSRLSGTDELSNTDNSGVKFDLLQNSPNPFNPATVINYQIPFDNFVTLKVFDVAGKEVGTIVNDYQKAGDHYITFDGSSLSSGMYYYKIVSGNFTAIRKMLLLK